MKNILVVVLFYTMSGLYIAACSLHPFSKEFKNDDRGEYLQESLEQNPHDFEYYRKLKDFLLWQNRGEEARTIMEYGLEMNPTSYEVLLMKAEVERFLLHFEAAEEALLEARKQAPQNTEVLDALLVFRQETLESQEEYELLQYLFKLAQEDKEKERYGLWLLQYYWKAKHDQELQALISNLKSSSFPGWLYRLKLKLREGKLDDIEILKEEPEVDSELYYQFLLRLVPLSGEPVVLNFLQEKFKSGLENFDQEEVRLFCLWGLWEIAWVEEAWREHWGVPPEHYTYLNRIEKILGNGNQRWFVRVAMVADLIFDQERASQYQEYFEATDFSFPKPDTIKDLMTLWRFESFLELDLPHQALEILEGSPELLESPDFLLVRKQVLFQAGLFQELIKDIEQDLENNQASDLRADILLLRWNALCALGEFDKVLGEIEQEQELEEGFQKHHKEEQIFLQQLARYRQKKWGR